MVKMIMTVMLKMMMMVGDLRALAQRDTCSEVDTDLRQRYSEFGKALLVTAGSVFHIAVLGSSCWG